MSGSGSGSGSGRDRFPFTGSQWQELEHQALIFKYMVAGMPIPPDLLFTVKRSLEYSSSSSSSLSSKLLLHQPQHVGWNCFQMGFGRKIDPEPGRCRRTDGKKWRCSKEAYPDSKYCERHMHRGRNRSRKPVEVVVMTTPTPTPTPTTTTNNSSISNPNSSFTTPNPNPNPNLTSSSSYSMPSDTHHNHHPYNNNNNNTHAHHSNYFLYPRSSSTRPQDNTTHLLLDPHKDYYRRNRYGDGMKEESDNKSVFLSMDESWQLKPLTMGEQRIYSDLDRDYSCLQLQGLNDETSKQYQQQDQDLHFYSLGTTTTTTTTDHIRCGFPLKIERQHEPQPEPEPEPQRQVMHHFFDEWPPTNKDSSWLDSEDKSSSNHKTQLSISIPKYSHDFFTTHNDN